MGLNWEHDLDNHIQIEVKTAKPQFSSIPIRFKISSQTVDFI